MLKKYILNIGVLLPLSWEYHYIVESPEITSTGHNFFTSPNPPYGVKLSYYLGNSILSKFEERQNEESNKFNRGETIDYPSA